MGVGRQRLVLVFSIFKLAFYFCVLYMRFLFLFSEYIYPFFYFSFMTLRWIDDEDVPSADTVDADVAITLLL